MLITYVFYMTNKLEYNTYNVASKYLLKTNALLQLPTLERCIRNIILLIRLGHVWHMIGVAYECHSNVVYSDTQAPPNHRLSKDRCVTSVKKLSHGRHLPRKCHSHDNLSFGNTSLLSKMLSTPFLQL